MRVQPLDWLEWMIDKCQITFEVRTVDGRIQTWVVQEMIASGGPIRLVYDEVKVREEWRRLREEEAGGDA